MNIEEIETELIVEILPPKPKRQLKPLEDIDAEVVERLASIHCTVPEIASVVGCSKKTIERFFMSEVRHGRQHGKMSLKRTMFKIALGGDTKMLIWLSKQHLGMKDNRHVADEQKQIPVHVTVNELPI